MKFKKFAAIISAAALALTLTGCGNNSELSNAFTNNPQNGQSNGTTFDPFASKPVESMPVESEPAVQLPDIPVNDAAAFEYKYDSELGGMVITDYKLQSPKVHIPDKLENEKVVKVDFSGVSKDITHIIMPDSVKEFSFSDTIKGALQFVNIPKSVTSIVENSFKGCSNLTSITIPDSVNKIGNYAFSNTGLTSVTIPDSVTEVATDDDFSWGINVFNGCTSLTQVTYKGKTYDIENLGALCDAINLGENYIKIEDGTLKTVSRAATEIVIPNSVTEIDHHVFDDCTYLTSIDVASGDTKYYSIDGILYEKSDGGGKTILKCPEGKVGSIVIPDGVTEIGYNAFGVCTGLTSITIPNSVTEIGQFAFGGCTGLISVTIGNNVTLIRNDFFYRCKSLKSINVTDGNSQYFSLDGMLCKKSEDGGITLCCCPQGMNGRITIPDSVTEIGYHAFNECTGLTSATIPNSVTEIGDWAFEGCTNLTSITIPDSVNKIGNYAFSNIGLTSVTIPDSVTEIGERAFYKCTGLTSITIPDSVTEIRGGAFEGCTNLKSATYKGKTYDYEHISDLYHAIYGN